MVSAVRAPGNVAGAAPGAASAARGAGIVERCEGSAVWTRKAPERVRTQCVKLTLDLCSAKGWCLMAFSFGPEAQPFG